MGIHSLKIPYGTISPKDKSTEMPSLPDAILLASTVREFTNQANQEYNEFFIQRMPLVSFLL